MIKREFDARYLNSVANDPAVRGGSRIKEDIDMTPMAQDYRNLILTYEGGGFLVLWKGNGVYEVHTMALKGGRGCVLRDAIKDALEYMFFRTDCERLITVAYKDNPASVALSDAFFERRGSTELLNYYELRYSNWVQQCKTAKDAGHQFHAGVETNHEEDDTHDYHVGGAIQLIQNGNTLKAIKLYNEWAVMSGYEQAILVNAFPLIVHIGDMKVIYQDNKLGEIICQ